MARFIASFLFGHRGDNFYLRSMVNRQTWQRWFHFVPEFPAACLKGKNSELTGGPASCEESQRVKVVWEFRLRAGVSGHFWYFVTVLAVTMKFAAFEKHETPTARFTNCGVE